MAKLDVDEMIRRFADRAEAAKDRPLPPVAGAERNKFIAQRDTHYLDYNLIAHASWEVEDGHLVLRIPLRPEG